MTLQLVGDHELPYRPGYVFEQASYSRFPTPDTWQWGVYEITDDGPRLVITTGFDRVGPDAIDRNAPGWTACELAEVIAYHLNKDRIDGYGLDHSVKTGLHWRLTAMQDLFRDPAMHPRLVQAILNDKASETSFIQHWPLPTGDNGPWVEEDPA